MSLASLYAQTKNPGALLIADTLLKAKKWDVEKQAMFIKGLYFNNTGEKLKAIAFFDKCILLDYTFMYAYREKSIALYDMGKYEEALAVLEKAVTLQNNFDEAYYWKGRCLERLGKKPEAVEAYQEAILYNRDYIEAKDALTRLGAAPLSN